MEDSTDPSKLLRSPPPLVEAYLQIECRSAGVRTTVMIWDRVAALAARLAKK